MQVLWRFVKGFLVMKKGMKFLRRFMLTFLAAICLAMAVAVFLHFGSTGGRNDADIDQYQNDRIEITVPDVINIDNGNTVTDYREDYRFWQRASTKQEGTGYWQYYPIIPYDILPGETVVLNVSAINFKGWEVDVNRSQVELFNETSDDENVYISFIMPDERVSIAALYENEIPNINYENQREAVMSMKSLHEYGAAPVATSDGGLRPEQNATIILPAAVVGVAYPIRLSDPIGVPDGWLLDWRFEIPDTLPWLTFDQTPQAIGGGGLFDGMPQPGDETLEPIQFRVRIYQYREGQNPATEAVLWDAFWFAIRVWGPDTPPSIARTTFPDGMVGVPYQIPIEIAFSPEGATWDWTIVDDRPLPDGLDLYFDKYGDSSRAVIIGEPEDTAANLNTTGFNFTISIEPTNRDQFPLLTAILTVNYNIRIWQQPEIVPAVPLPIDGGPILPNLFDGIANIEGVIKDYNVTFNSSTPNVPPGSDSTTVPTIEWTWRVSSGSLPDGLRLPVLPGTLPATGSSTTIGGFPTTVGNSTFTIRFTANPNVLIGWVEKTYTIKITQPPWFDTDSRLFDGMEDRPSGSTNEPEEEPDWYNEPIGIAGLPVGTKWTWRVSAGTQPSGLTFIPSLPSTGIIPEPATGTQTYQHNFDLSGVPGPTARGEYKFTLELECVDPVNPNIRGAKIDKEFEVKIWPRTYLHISMLGTGNRGYVRRDDGKDPDWNDLNKWTEDDARLYEGRRAVMPGTRGIISTNSSGGNVRWEISHTYNAAGANTSTPPTYSVGSRRLADTGGIGGPDSIINGVRSGYGIYPPPPEAGQHGYVVINMPPTETTGVYDGNVYLRAEQIGTGRPVITSSPLRQGTVGGPYQASITISRDDMGSGPNYMKWEIIPGYGILPPGLKIDEDAGARTEIEGIPLLANSFNFRVGITLPGTMRIERDYNIIITDWDGLGDVNNDGVVDLRDLVLLVRYQDDKSLNINLRNSRLSTNGEGDHVPAMPDIRLLARYLSSNIGSMNP